MASPLMNGGPLTPDIVEVMRLLEMGLVTSIFFYRKRPERRTLKIKLESRQLMWVKGQTSRPEGIGKPCLISVLNSLNYNFYISVVNLFNKEFKLN